MYLYLILDGMARYNAPFSKISKIHHFMEEVGEKMQRTHEKNPMSANRMLRGAIKAGGFSADNLRFRSVRLWGGYVPFLMQGKAGWLSSGGAVTARHPGLARNFFVQCF